jgi:hypothetical protein
MEYLRFSFILTNESPKRNVMFNKTEIYIFSLAKKINTGNNKTGTVIVLMATANTTHIIVIMTQQKKHYYKNKNVGKNRNEYSQCANEVK